MLHLVGPVGSVRHLRYTLDGRALVVATLLADGNSRVSIWDMPGGTLRPDALVVPGAIHALALHATGTVIALGGLHRAVAVYRWRTGWERIQMLSEWHTQQVNAVAFSPDERYLVSGTGDPTRIPAGGELLRWSNWHQEPVVQRVGVREGIGAAAYLPTGQLVFGDGVGGLHLEGELWAGRRPPSIGQHGLSVRGVVLSPDGRRLVSLGGGKVRLWRVPVPQPLPLPPATVEIPASAPLAAAFHPSGRVLALATDAGVLYIDSDPASTRYGSVSVGYAWPIGALTAVDFAPDGMTAACAGANGVVLVWDCDGV
jgi:WD40 repeat protein